VRHRSTVNFQAKKAEVGARLSVNSQDLIFPAICYIYPVKRAGAIVLKSHIDRILELYRLIDKTVTRTSCNAYPFHITTSSGAVCRVEQQPAVQGIDNHDLIILLFIRNP